GGPVPVRRPGRLEARRRAAAEPAGRARAPGRRGGADPGVVVAVPGARLAPSPSLRAEEGAAGGCGPLPSGLRHKRVECTKAGVRLGFFRVRPRSPRVRPDGGSPPGRGAPGAPVQRPRWPPAKGVVAMGQSVVVLGAQWGDEGKG